MRLTRREFALRSVGALAGLSLAGGLPAAGGLAAAEQEAKPFDFDAVVRKAEALAGADFQPVPENLPKPLADLDFDHYREIRFRPDRAIWRDQTLPFQVQLFHLGAFYKRPVAINLIEGDAVRRLTFATELFDYGKNEVGVLPADLGFAGFRIHAPMNLPTYYDEVVAFLGASYFRAVGKGQVYGLSARGLAIDTAVPSGEEFPFFREFWIVRPAPDARDITIYALLDSRSVAGAYKFTLLPGETTEIAVACRLFMRQDVAKFGAAPLTSMFLYGEDGTRQFDDFRPEVHDSDGLLMQAGSGEWIWRPLVNPRKLRVSGYNFENLRGFGLIQRDRDFRNYEDLEALYQQRPSCWVEPGTNGWGPGRVELVEIPSESEKYDNIVAFWVSGNPVKAKDSLSLEYRLLFAKRLPAQSPGGRVTATRTTPGPGGTRRFILDFGGGRLADLKSGDPVELVVDVSKGSISTPVVQKNPVSGGWRAFFDLSPGDAKLIEFRAFLRMGRDALSETWSYQWSPA